MAGLVAAVSLEGCGLFTKSYDFTEAENSIYVEDNATIRAAMISDFDKDYYSIDELAGVAQQEALSFNKNVYGCSYYKMCIRDRSGSQGEGDSSLSGIMLLRFCRRMLPTSRVSS